MSSAASALENCVSEQRLKGSPRTHAEGSEFVGQRSGARRSAAWAPQRRRGLAVATLKGDDDDARPAAAGQPSGLGAVWRRDRGETDHHTRAVGRDPPRPEVSPVLALDPDGTVVNGHQAMNGSRPDWA